MPDVQCLQGRAHKQAQTWPRCRSCFALGSPIHAIMLQDRLHLGIFPQFQQKHYLTGRPRGYDDGPSEAMLMFHQNRSEKQVNLFGAMTDFRSVTALRINVRFAVSYLQPCLSLLWVTSLAELKRAWACCW